MTWLAALLPSATATAATATTAAAAASTSASLASWGMTVANAAPTIIGASTPAAATSLFTAANLQLLGTGLSAVSSIYQSGQQAEAYRLQSTQAALKGRREALQYESRALDTLRQNAALNASLRARAAAGGINPFSGSPLSLAQANDIAAYEEARIDRENAEMALYGGLAQSQALQAAAATAETYGYLNAAMNAATGGAKFLDVRKPGIA